MKIEALIKELNSKNTMNDALSILYELFVDTDEALIERLAKIISMPEKIDNTNRFALLLAALGSESFIEPLINNIMQGKPSETSWLGDYMYALYEVLDEQDEWYPAEDQFVDLIGDWLLSTGGGEISWKSGLILENLHSERTFQYLQKGALDEELFVLTRKACIRGLVDQYEDEAPKILHELKNDREDEVREIVRYAQGLLDDRSTV